MLLYLVGACDMCWHCELSKSLLTPPRGWWLGSSYSSASRAATNQPTELETKKTVKLTRRTADYSLGEDSTAADSVWNRDIGLFSGLGLVCCVRCHQDLLHGHMQGKGLLNKCSQHYFLHPVWLHFSPKSNITSVTLSLE